MAGNRDRPFGGSLCPRDAGSVSWSGCQPSESREPESAERLGDGLAHGLGDREAWRWHPGKCRPFVAPSRVLRTWIHDRRNNPTALERILLLSKLLVSPLWVYGPFGSLRIFSPKAQNEARGFVLTPRELMRRRGFGTLTGFGYRQHAQKRRKNALSRVFTASERGQFDEMSPLCRPFVIPLSHPRRSQFLRHVVLTI